MRSFVRFKSLQFKLLAAIFSLLTITLAAWGWITIKREREFLISQIERRAQAISRIITLSNTEAMLSRDYPVIRTNVKMIGEKDPEVVAIRIFRDGEIVVQYQAAEVTPETNRFLKIRDNMSFEGYNLGEVEVVFSTKEALARVQSRSITLVATVVLLFAVLSVLITFILNKLIIARVSRLSQFARRIGEGSLQEPLDLKGLSEDEMGELANAMNQMVQNLEVARKREVEQELLKKEMKEIKRHDEEIMKITSQVAHDIRSPLSAIQVALDHLSQSSFRAPAKEAEYLNLLELGAARLKGIADDLLKEHGGPQKGKSVFSIHKVLDELAGEYSTQKFDQEIRFKKEYRGAISCVGDRARLQRAFGNILNNAAEAMNHRGLITIRTWVEGGQAVVAIADAGPGMPPEKLSRVLAGGYTEGKEEGHGIGMMVVQEVVKEQGGVLEASSEIGKGTTFRIKLPLADPQLLRADSSIEEEARPFELTLKPHETVIVIDDDSSIRLQWELILKEKELRVSTYESYEDLTKREVEALEARTAIVDYHFDHSELNGIEIMKKLKKRRFTNLYLCTAEYWKPVLQHQARELGFTICPKPLPKIEVRMHPSEALWSSDRTYKVLVIDDDPLMGLAWKTAQERLGIGELHYFANLESLISSRVELSSLDIAFVDKNLKGSRYDGDAVFRYLKEKKVPKVVMASGEDGRKIPESIEGLL